MIEKGKSFILALLVGSSLLQSYLLAYHSTDYESILESEYIDTETIGTQEKQENLVFPQQIVLHGDENSHTVLYPGHYFYRIIMEDLQSHSYEGIRSTDKTTQQLQMLMNKQAGIEIRFPGKLPLQIIQYAIPIQPGLPNDTPWVKSIWATIDEENKSVEIYLIGDGLTETYTVSATDLTVDKVGEYIRFGDYQSPKYAVSPEGYLYPNDTFPMAVLTFEYTSIAGDRLENMLFPDPGITRSLPTSDGMEIYTDGKRGLEIDRSQLWMSYTDPIASIGGTFSSANDLNTATQFINRHGGWNGLFELEQVSVGLTQSEPRFIFRQWLESYPSSYPVLDQKDGGFGLIEVLLQQEVITEYKRSLMLLDSASVKRQQVYLPGGESLQARIELTGLSRQIERLIPAYKPRVTPEFAEFIPIWAMILSNGEMLELP